MTTTIETQSELDYRRIEQAIEYLQARHSQQPSLEEVADVVGVSAFHFQRLFTRWAGISPKKFLQVLTLQHAKRLLRESQSPLLTVAMDTGLSGTGRLHDLFVNLEAMTPGEYKAGGDELTVRYGFHPTPFGRALIGATDRGICGISFEADHRAGLDEIQSRWPNSTFIEDSAATLELAKTVFEHNGSSRITCLVRGTAFQCKVWQALLSIPAGSAVSYSEVAAAAGNRSAIRAAASAVGANPIAYLIPCHRVIRTTGALGGYKWGLPRKQAMLAREWAQKNPLAV